MTDLQITESDKTRIEAMGLRVRLEQYSDQDIIVIYHPVLDDRIASINLFPISGGKFLEHAVWSDEKNRWERNNTWGRTLENLAKENPDAVVKSLPQAAVRVNKRINARYP